MENKTHKTVPIIGIIFILLIVFGVMAFFKPNFGRPIDRERIVEEQRVYESDEFGFSFEIPPEYELFTYSPENISIGIQTDDIVQSVADVNVLQSSDAEETFKNYEEFLYARTRLMCAADSPTLSLNCTEAEQVQPFTSRSGISGTVFYLKEVITNTKTGTTTEAGKGPFFAFNISANNPDSTYTALLIHAPIALSADQVDSEVIREIAETVQVERVETRE